MRIENTVEVDAPLDRVWALVNDIPRVAPCMPGAALTGVVDEDTYEGTVAVKLGPLRMSYKGKVVVEGVDEANHSARLAATGKDTKGAGTARASVETRMEAVGDNHTRLLVTSDVQLTGKVASFGRGGAINDVATRLFGQFADCLRATLEAESAPAGSAAEDGATAASGGRTAEATSAETSPSASPQAGPPGTVPSPPASPDAGPPSDAGAAGDGTTTTGEGATAAPPATPPPPVTPRSPQAPAPRPVEALDAGSLAGT
ncbi:MAG TPA: SRPBCC domain-containing protein, partial [Actinomycetota bacterium]